MRIRFSKCLQRIGNLFGKLVEEVPVPRMSNKKKKVMFIKKVESGDMDRQWIGLKVVSESIERPPANYKAAKISAEFFSPQSHDTL